MKHARFLTTMICGASLTATSVANTPYITKVFDFVPAPGQFVNQVPEIEASDSHEQVCAKVLEQIGFDKNPGMISLGAFGGYVVFGFDHPVINVEGEYDFKIYGNAFLSGQNAQGGSAEPGIVMVSADINGNGLPDDPWYELAGSDYSKETTLKGYKITYYKPESGHTPVPDPNNAMIVDKEYIRWTASDGEEGYVQKNRYHGQSYWPEWINSDTLVLEGTRLAPNGIDTSGNGSYFVLMTLDWGYVDNRPNNDPDDKGFDIGWAVDSEGKQVHLPKIDFVRVHTAVNQSNGWLGENSTEIVGAEDLHPDAIDVSDVNEVLFINKDNTEIFDLMGRKIANPQPGTLYIRGGRKFIQPK